VSADFTNRMSSIGFTLGFMCKFVCKTDRVSASQL